MMSIKLKKIYIWITLLISICLISCTDRKSNDEIEKSWNSIIIGDSKESLIKILGEPNEIYQSENIIYKNEVLSWNINSKKYRVFILGNRIFKKTIEN